MRWRDVLLLGPVALVAVMAGVMMLDLPPTIAWLITGSSGVLLVAYLVLEWLRPRTGEQRRKSDS